MMWKITLTDTQTDSVASLAYFPYNKMSTPVGILNTHCCLIARHPSSCEGNYNPNTHWTLFQIQCIALGLHIQQQNMGNLVLYYTLGSYRNPTFIVQSHISLQENDDFQPQTSYYYHCLISTGDQSNWGVYRVQYKQYIYSRRGGGESKRA